MPENQPPFPGGRHPEFKLRHTPIGAADAAFHQPQPHLAGSGRRRVSVVGNGQAARVKIEPERPHAQGRVATANSVRPGQGRSGSSRRQIHTVLSNSFRVNRFNRWLPNSFPLTSQAA